MDLVQDTQGGREDVWFTSHLNENVAEISAVAALFPGSDHYLGTYHQHGLVNERSVFAHNVHASDKELAMMAEAGAWAAHCPTSNSALGSGLFPLRRHVEHGVGVALGSDVGAGTGLFLPKEGLQAYFMQQLLGARRAAADPGAPAVPGDPGRRVGPRSGGPGRRFHPRQGIRRGVAAAGRRAAPTRSTTRMPPTAPTHSPGPSRSPRPPTWPACGSGGNRPTSADTDPARQGRYVQTAPDITRAARTSHAPGPRPLRNTAPRNSSAPSIDVRRPDDPFHARGDRTQVL